MLASAPIRRTILSLRNVHRSLSTTTPRLTSLPYSFLPANSLDPKPRKKGLTEIRGPYYAPVTKTYLDELLSDCGDYVDGIKFAGGAFSLMPEERLKGLIDTAHKHSMRPLLVCMATSTNSSQTVMSVQVATLNASSLLRVATKTSSQSTSRRAKTWGTYSPRCAAMISCATSSQLRRAGALLRLPLHPHRRLGFSRGVHSRPRTEAEA